MTVDEVLGQMSERLTPEGKRYLAPLILAGILAGAGMSTCLVDGTEPAPVIKLPQREELSYVDDKGAAAHVKPIGSTAVLRSPFTAEHEERESSRHVMTAKPEAVTPKQAPPRPKKEPVRLVGTARSASGDMAILSRGTEHWSMAPGETRGDVELIELTENEAVISTAEGVRTLRLPGR